MVTSLWIAVVHSWRDLRQQPKMLYQREEARFGRSGLCACWGQGSGGRGGMKETLSLIMLQPVLAKWEFTWNRGLRSTLQVEGKVYAKAQG